MNSLVSFRHAEPGGATASWAASPPAARTVLVLGVLPESLVTFRGPLLRAMVARGHRVIACASGPSPKVRETLAGWGVAYRDVALRRTGMNPLHDLASLRALTALMRDVRPDILLAYTIKPVIFGGLAARLTGVPRIFAMIEGVGYAFTGRGLRARVAMLAASALYRVSLRAARSVFFLNPDNRALFQRLGLLRSGDQAVVLNGIGVDLEEFSPVALPGRPSFLLIARFLRDKGLVEYAEAARLLRRRYPDAAFRLVGWRDEHPMAVPEAELRSWIEEGTIECLGRLDDVRPAIAASSVYVLPSYHEGTPRTVLEAMAMGRPIVTTDAPGCRETVVPGLNGLLVPVGDVAALAAAMESLIRSPERVAAMGAASRHIAETKYDIHRVNAVILETMGLV
ncbi:MAG TPA: glycosyltransferase family 4 protein [Geminicoccaceae bacterium]|nr:glycosyltransferase family 4 protein [Geminicoccaceae bacterium]